MAAATTPPELTLEEFHRRYANSERAYEYWFGEAVEKPAPTWLHSVLQLLLGELLYRAGYKSASELELRIDPNFEARPDVCATRTSIRDRYPTGPHAIEIVVEILSPEDKMAQLLAKCQHYMNLGIAQVFVADPETETAWQWNPERRQLDRVDTWTLTNGETIHMADVWAQMHQRS